MKLPAFTYHAPSSADEAAALLAEHGGDAKVLAGGQSLLPLLALRLAQPEHLVDVGRAVDLAEVQVDAPSGELVVGAAARQAAVLRSGLVRGAAPLLAEAVSLVGHRAIRTRGTVGGSIAHADPAAELPAAATCLGARMVLRNATGEREVAAGDFFEGYLTTAVEEDELLVEMRFPPRRPRTGWSVQEVSRRNGDFAMVGVAVLVELDGDRRLTAATLTYFGVGSRPERLDAVEASLVGESAEPSVFDSAGRLAAGELAPVDDLHASSAYRAHVAGVLTRRALGIAAERAA